MKKKKLFTAVLAATVSLTMLASAGTVWADGPVGNRVRTYSDLQNLTGDYAEINVQEPFGWPETETTVNLKNFSLETPWHIPAQITVNQNGAMKWSTKESPLTIQGKWNIKDTDETYMNSGYMIVENGGILSLEGLEHGHYSNKSVTVNNGGTVNTLGETSFENLTVKSGGTLNTHDMAITSIFSRDTANLEKGAIVNSDGRWSFRLAGGTLNSDNATINGTFGILNENDAHSDINGTLTVDNLLIMSDADIDAVVNIRNNLDISSGSWDGESVLTIENGGIVNVTADFTHFGYNDHSRQKIIIKSGGVLNLQKLTVSKNCEIQIEKGGILNVGRELNLTEGGRITGNGTVNLKAPSYYYGSLYRDAIASTISVNDNGKHDTFDRASYIKDGYRYYPCAYCGKILEKVKINNPTPKPSSEAKVGTTFTVSGMNYKVTQTGSHSSVSVKKGLARSSVSIPSKVTYKKKSYAVTAVDTKAFYNNKKVTAITVPSSVKTIGTQAFANCTKLKKVSGFTGVTTIGTQAFYKCSALTQIGKKGATVTLPGVQRICAGAFQNCKKINKITISSKELRIIENKAIYGINKKTVIRVPASKVNDYKKLFKKSTGYVKTMKIKK